ncbi:MAG TPA: thiol peroxidase [Cyclobacteriaceae bacterium]|nr:thiol peroxidase [Cyclobacteriaceae bacterium]
MYNLLVGETKVHTNGDLPAVGTTAPDFTLTGNKLNDVSLKEYRGHSVVLNIFPSIDTSTCAQSVREFNRRAANLSRTVVLCIAKDLPYAMRRFCGAEGIDRVVTLSDFRSKDFGNDYHVEMIDGPMRGLFARVVIVIDEYGVVKYTEVVPVIGQEPNYEAALKAL